VQKQASYLNVTVKNCITEIFSNKLKQVSKISQYCCTTN